jgi:hypothetical protein
MAELVPAPEKQQTLRETFLFGLLNRMNQGLRARTPFEKFKKYIANELPGVELPDDKTLSYLYERAFDANADRRWVKAMQKIAKSTSWKAHMDWLHDATEVARQLVVLLETSDRLLPRRDAQQARFVAQSVERLRCRLLEIYGLDKRGGAIAKARNWNSALRQARKGMSRALQTGPGSLNDAQRADVIRLAVEIAGLKPQDTIEAVVRQLHRVRAKSKGAPAPRKRKPHLSKTRFRL